MHVTYISSRQGMPRFRRGVNARQQMLAKKMASLFVIKGDYQPGVSQTALGASFFCFSYLSLFVFRSHTLFSFFSATLCFTSLFLALSSLCLSGFPLSSRRRSLGVSPCLSEFRCEKALKRYPSGYLFGIIFIKNGTQGRFRDATAF